MKYIKLFKNFDLISEKWGRHDIKDKILDLIIKNIKENDFKKNEINQYSEEIKKYFKSYPLSITIPSEEFDKISDFKIDDIIVMIKDIGEKQPSHRDKKYQNAHCYNNSLSNDLIICIDFYSEIYAEITSNKEAKAKIFDEIRDVLSHEIGHRISNILNPKYDKRKRPFLSLLQFADLSSDLKFLLYRIDPMEMQADMQSADETNSTLKKCYQLLKKYRKYTEEQLREECIRVNVSRCKNPFDEFKENAELLTDEEFEKRKEERLKTEEIPYKEYFGSFHKFYVQFHKNCETQYRKLSKWYGQF